MSSKTVGILVTVVVFLLVSAPFIYTAVGNGFFGEPPGPKLTMPTNAKECVRPTDWMRANHQKLLMDERDDAVREGVRTISKSLNNCKSCHTKREEFCDSCHKFVGAKVECFECHYLP